jgi:hypothetical protein
VNGVNVLMGFGVSGVALRLNLFVAMLFSENAIDHIILALSASEEKRKWEMSVEWQCPLTP